MTREGLTIPLSTPLTKLSKGGSAAKFNPHLTTQVTKLSNGLTVASEDHWGQFATLGGKFKYSLFYP